ncbi:MAG TPA: protocatechuate 3,4-dioxygenase [Bdellovibrionales bacterium]|nr:protocatechuate 3,4-dioxygenase [Bdellovibrionales bacterium]
MKLNRRDLMLKSLGAVGIAAAGSEALAQAVCGLTPQQPEGPFYPIDNQLDKDNDLTRVQGAVARPQGQLIYVRGVVTDQNCLPVAGALVEIWQACHTGKYNHKSDPNPAPLDPNFQYWGQAITDAQGRYMFKTILPGAYPASSTWMRPPHIHYKISKRAYAELITQLYFKNNPLNNKDLILNALPAAERAKVIVELTAPEQGYDPGSKIATFNITLKRLA